MKRLRDCELLEPRPENDREDEPEGDWDDAEADLGDDDRKENG